MSDSVTKIRTTEVRGTYEVKLELLSTHKVLKSLEINSAAINTGVGN